jgi:glycosyltransferase involved in cell wall biosynthesis
MSVAPFGNDRFITMQPSVACIDVTAEDIEVSIVMPCLDEARTVGQCIQEALQTFRSLDLRGEVIVADNGSTDRSREIALAGGARVVEVLERGYGRALRAGIGAARGRYIIMGDADNSYDFADLGLFIVRLREGHDLIVGNRFLGGIKPGAMPWAHRYVGNPVLSGLLNLFFFTVRSATAASAPSGKSPSTG